MAIRVTSISPIVNHNLVKAVVELEIGGLRLRGLKLEHACSQWRLTPPGRKIQGRWQILYDFIDGRAYQELLDQIVESVAGARVEPRGSAERREVEDGV